MGWLQCEISVLHPRREIGEMVKVLWLPLPTHAVGLYGRGRSSFVASTTALRNLSPRDPNFNRDSVPIADLRPTEIAATTCTGFGPRGTRLRHFLLFFFFLFLFPPDVCLPSRSMCRCRISFRRHGACDIDALLPVSLIASLLFVLIDLLSSARLLRLVATERSNADQPTSQHTLFRGAPVLHCEY